MLHYRAHQTPKCIQYSTLYTTLSTETEFLHKWLPNETLAIFVY